MYRKSPTKKLHKLAFRVFNTRLLIDSSKRISWIKSTAKNCPDYRVIKMNRYVLGTLLKTKRKQGSIDNKHASDWVKGNIRIDRFIRSVPKNKRLSVRYEDLCEIPDAVLGRCCNFIGIDYEPGMHEFWKKHHHVVGGNSKPISAVRLYHNLVQLEALHPDVQDFFKKYGISSVKLDTRYIERFSEEEKRIFRKIGGDLCKKYGYRLE